MLEGLFWESGLAGLLPTENVRNADGGDFEPFLCVGFVVLGE